MPYANSNRIVTVASVSVSPSSVSNVTLFSPVAPLTRENGGDLLDGDRWVDVQSFVESVWWQKQWLFLNQPNLDGIIDSGGAEDAEEDAILDLGGALVDELEEIIDGGSATL